MIQLRRVDGSLSEIPPDAKFVELVNDHDGRVMLVVFQIAPGQILLIRPGSSDAKRYEELFIKQNVKFQESMIEQNPNG